MIGKVEVIMGDCEVVITIKSTTIGMGVDATRGFVCIVDRGKIYLLN